MEKIENYGYYPPDLMTSLDLSVMVSHPLGSMVAMSPVANHPSFKKDSFLSSWKYDLATVNPFTHK